MSFLRNFRNNITLNSTPSNNHKNKKSSARSVISVRSNNNDDNKSNTYSRKVNNTTLKKQPKVGKENPRPIIVYVEKHENKKPGILRTNTFTKNEDERPVTRSNTFTINESDDERLGNTNTYTKKKDIAKEDVFETIYSKNNNTNLDEKLPVVVDSRTYRKKSIKTSKPVQKVESFIRRFEKSIFGSDKNEKKPSRKNSKESSDGSYIPQFRDIGIECKLDEEERMLAYGTVQRNNRQNSRDSLIDLRDKRDQSSSSQISYHRDEIRTRERSASPQKRYGSREQVRAHSPQKKYSNYERERDPQPQKRYSVSDYERLRSRERSVSPTKRYELIEFKSPQKTYRTLDKAKQKEQELGYSTIDKRRSHSTYGTLPRDKSPEKSKSILVNSRNIRDNNQRNRSFSNPTNHRVGFDSDPKAKYTFKGDTYNTLKEEYEHSRRRPVGIASPRLNSERVRTASDFHYPKPTIASNPKKEPELPKYTFGTHVEARKSRFQQFQKSFKHNNQSEDNDSEVYYQQSFFVPI